MVTVKVKPGESFESAYRRFKRLCERDRVFTDIKKHERYEKPSEIRKRKENSRKMSNKIAKQ